jgi:hypothetical protein
VLSLTTLIAPPRSYKIKIRECYSEMGPVSESQGLRCSQGLRPNSFGGDHPRKCALPLRCSEKGRLTNESVPRIFAVPCRRDSMLSLVPAKTSASLPLFIACISLSSMGVSARAQGMDSCISAYRDRYGVSADEAIRQCRRFGMPQDLRGRSDGECLAEASRSFGNVYMARDFCKQGGDANCLAGASRSFGNVYMARDFCAQGGDANCLAAASRSFGNVYMARDFCRQGGDANCLATATRTFGNVYMARDYCKK